MSVFHGCGVQVWVVKVALLYDEAKIGNPGSRGWKVVGASV